MSSPTQTPQTPPPMPPRYYVRRRSIAGPIVLIALGVLFLLGNMHVLTWPILGIYFARYWPVLIILWGVIKLYEHWSDTRQGLPGRGIGAGGVLLIIFLIIFGMSATAAYHVNWNAFGNDVDFDNDFAGLFGNTYNFTQTVEQPFTAGNSLRVVDDRGSVTVNTWDEPKVKVVINKRVIAGDEKESNDIDQKTQTTINNVGNVTTIDANTLGSGRHPVESNLQVWLPAKAAVDLAVGRGDINVATRTGDVHISTNRGDVTVQQVTGNVAFSSGRGDVRAQDIQGDVSISGRVNDATVHDVTGSLTLSGDFFGEMDLAHITKGVNFHSSRTDMEMSSLPGDLNMESGDLRIRTVTGPVRVVTRSKDIHLDDVSGELKVEDTNGLVEYHAGNKLGPVEITNTRGDVQVTLPAKSSFQIDAQARRGDVSSEFEGISTTEQRNDHSMSGSVGSGGPMLRISDTGGDISLRKGNPATPAEDAAAPRSLPPDQTITPGGGVESTTPPKAPRTPKAPKAPAAKSDMTQMRWHAGPHELYFGPPRSM